MTCTVVTLPTGGRAIVCSDTKRCKCGKPAKLLCDWKVPEKASGTCDRPICSSCTHSPAEGKDLCPEHASLWKARLSERQAHVRP